MIFSSAYLRIITYSDLNPDLNPESKLFKTETCQGCFRYCWGRELVRSFVEKRVRSVGKRESENRVIFSYEYVCSPGALYYQKQCTYFIHVLYFTVQYLSQLSWPRGHFSRVDHLPFCPLIHSLLMSLTIPPNGVFVKFVTYTMFLTYFKFVFNY